MATTVTDKRQVTIVTTDPKTGKVKRQRLTIVNGRNLEVTTT